ncbi:hypothetical protein O6H91_03G091000 [Diphasiastrum complanatum]|uniref:Uncharacterized protein n=1 Tax=Diphasiastrum complanatum TaxID=34168 RepID=A0ACC2E9C6_DIPCM|nr:hypothetical protein O6H91_03G091000 [Diphasiastrum complanatum]
MVLCTAYLLAFIALFLALRNKKYILLRNNMVKSFQSTLLVLDLNLLTSSSFVHQTPCFYLTTINVVFFCASMLVVVPHFVFKTLSFKTSCMINMGNKLKHRRNV